MIFISGLDFLKLCQKQHRKGGHILVHINNWSHKLSCLHKSKIFT